MITVVKQKKYNKKKYKQKKYKRIQKMAKVDKMFKDFCT